MAKLKDFIDQVSFDEVWALLGQDRENMEQYKDACQSIYSELQAATPVENTDRMTIRFVMEEAPEWTFFFDDDATSEEDGTQEEETEDESPTLQVYGFIPGDDEGYAVGLKSPEILLGLDIDPETARDYTPQEIVANCLEEMIYSSTVASSAYGTEKDMAGGGLLASQNCMQEDIQNIDLEKLRQELGAIPKPTEDYKTKYGFLF